MFKKIRESRATRIICFFLAINMLAEIISPNMAFALTSGPSQPEVQSFEPVTTSDMVDLFSGDFKYNIPLMDVDGYPLNICYNSGVTMDQEASWVGLGWNLNVGAIYRNMRGLPDDFNGEEIVEKEFNTKDNITYGGHVKLGFEIFGWNPGKTGGTSSGGGSITMGMAVRHNNYTGIAVEQSTGFSLNAGNANKGMMNAGLGITSSADEGLNISPSVSFSYKTGKSNSNESCPSVGGGISLGINSRSGLKSLSFNTSVTPGEKSVFRGGIDSNGDIQMGFGKGQSGLGLSSGFSVSFSTPSYVPLNNFPMLNSSIAINTKLGGHVFGLDATIDVGGYYSKQRLATKNIYSPAYGYMYSEIGQFNENALLDFNREKDGGFTPGMEFLPLTNNTYDVYSLMGQGIGGTYRPFRNDVGHVFDPESESISDSYSLGMDATIGNLVKMGTDIGVVDVHTNTGKWDNDNSAKSNLINMGGGRLAEATYFKEVGEKSVESDPTRFDNVGNFDPIRVKLTGPAMFAKASSQFEKQNLSTGSISNLASAMPTNFGRTARDKRNKVISTLTYNEAKEFAIDKRYSTSSTYTLTSIDDYARAHHVYEVSVLNPDGSRYIYGLPAYNITQEEVSMNVSGNSIASNKDYAYGLVNYTPGSEDSKGNNKGIDNFYSRTTLPAYAHSYMLTSIVSSDYVDSDGTPGPSDGDLGDYKIFDYDEGIVENYEWRTPTGSNKVNYNENTKLATPGDDYGNYVWGKKNLVYINKITTKNYIAIFETGARQDALPVDKNGNKKADHNTRSRYLKKIKLYSKKDYILNGSTNAVPIKTANFIYDYSLCTNTYTSSPTNIDDVPNNSLNTTTLTAAHELSNDGGKLTLKQIYFTYGSTEAAKFSKYEFDYSATSNPAYDSKAYDRWGNYKPNPVATSTSTNLAADIAATGTILPNCEFPYTDQNKTAQDLNAEAWSLKTIKLPSGAEINVEYESDDYAYVQNLPAMDMFKITSIGTSSNPATYTSTTGSVKELMKTVSSSTSIAGDNNLYLYFQLKEPLKNTTYTTQTMANDYIKSHYVRDMVSGRYMYFRFLVNLTKQGTAGLQNLGNYFEYISGYAEIDDFGAIPGSPNYTHGYIRLKTVDIGKTTSSANVNPICKAAWQTGRTQFSQLVWDANFTPGGGAVDVVKALVNSSITKNIISAFMGPNLSLAIKDYGKQFIAGKSWMRLYDPTGKKLGGGSRVKQLTINDQWDDITSTHQYDFTYGQQYEYTTKENGEIISSGVAAYEPILGNDENPFRLPNYYRNQGNNPLKNFFLLNDDRFYKEEPYGESFFPAASVGYSNVKVMNLERTNGEPEPNTVTLVNAHATGHVIHKFYTAKDYPTIATRTKLDKKIFKPAFGSLFKIAARDYMTTSQGYVIETNDMHGKTKAIETYQQGKTDQPISKIEYYYKTQGANGYEEPSIADKYNDCKAKSNKLSNNCKVIDRAGVVTTKDIGVDYDVVSDFRESETNTIQAGIQANVSVFLVAIYPAVSVTIWPDFSYEKTRFRSAVITKVINRYGILDKTVATDLGSRIETADVAYDAETGTPLVSRTNNEFDDPIYSFTYPAHWAYDLMGQAYKNINARLTDISVASGGVATITLSPTTASSYFTAGDEVSLTVGASATKAWVCSVGSPSVDKFTLIDDAGNAVSTGTYTVKVLRSGRRNQQALPIGSVVSLVNPVATGTINFDKVTKTNAVEYSNQWQMHRGHKYDASEQCCELTNEGSALASMMMALNSNSELFSTTGAQLWAAPSTYSYTDFIPLNLATTQAPAATNAIWTYSATTNNVTSFKIDWLTGATSLYTCNIIATLPSGTNWPSITITGLVSVKSAGDCSSNGGMEMCVTTATSGTKCFTVQAGCWSLKTCPENPSNLTDCFPMENEKVNPFVQGIKGNWRTQKSWAYQAPRAQSTASANTNTRTDGYFSLSPASTTPTFYPYWEYNGSVFTPTNVSYWTYASEVTKYNPHNGAEIENKDALGRYSSAVYGYNETIPILVASNAKYNEVAYDGFEDYGFKTSACKKNHFNFYEYEGHLSTTEAHSGKYSLKLPPGNILSANRALITPSTTAYNSACTYSLVFNDFTGQFSPVNTTGSDQKYVLSYWVKENLSGTCSSPTVPVLTYTNAQVSIILVSSTGTLSTRTQSNVKKSSLIDGWQRVESTFTIPSTANYKSVKVTLKNNSPIYCPSSDVYFDDIRIHPFSSNIKTFVYHPVNMRFVAELDANNFATFYEYDEEGSLIRTKKETEKGIMTLKENKNHTKR